MSQSINILNVIHQLNQQKNMSVQCMYFTYYHYEKKGNNSFCNLLNKLLKEVELQIDCVNYKMTA